MASLSLLFSHLVNICIVTVDPFLPNIQTMLLLNIEDLDDVCYLPMRKRLLRLRITLELPLGSSVCTSCLALGFRIGTS